MNEELILEDYIIYREFGDDFTVVERAHANPFIYKKEIPELVKFLLETEESTSRKP